MRKIKSFVCTAFAVLLVLSFCVGAFAAEIVTAPGEKGTVTMNLVFDGKNVTDGEFGIYKIGNYAETVDGKNVFTRTDDFVALAVKYDDRFTKDGFDKISSTASEFIDKNSISPLQRITNTNGEIIFASLDKGLYLIKQMKKCDGFERINSFLIELPGENNSMSVIANEKFELNGENKPTQPFVPTTSPKPSPNGRLPQTGLNNLPVPIMMSLGLVFIVFGIIIKETAYRPKSKKT